MRLFKKMANAITNREQNKKLVEWQKRFEYAKQKYSNELQLMQKKFQL